MGVGKSVRNLILAQLASGASLDSQNSGSVICSESQGLIHLNDLREQIKGPRSFLCRRLCLIFLGDVANDAAWIACSEDAVWHVPGDHAARTDDRF